MATPAINTTELTFGQTVANAASSAWETTVDYSGRVWTWICNTVGYLADRIGAGISAIWNSVGPYLDSAREWVNQNRIEATVIVASAIAIGFVVHMFMCR